MLRQTKLSAADRALLWVAANRGVLTEIASKLRPPVTPQYVAQVLRGKRKSRGGRVERALARRGAPSNGRGDGKSRV
jgi:hypothetical protein